VLGVIQDIPTCEVLLKRIEKKLLRQLLGYRE
jgi:hypothetical protein